ncbi:hypothetical protein [Arthrobacter sp. S39]|uniref:hypothetical protein n=1 Tax=Arthrobacter sp. S39 TaxID=2509720 RepID=UPI001037D9CD|nr:hypothetical protein [Arthrobacter sp. S39]TAP44862.1 hypothetical protein EYS21_05025 [Arthrobacter sp. S39]
MSALWGTQTQLKRALLIAAALVIPLSGCEYGGPGAGPVQTSPQASTEPTRSFPDSLPKPSGFDDMREWSSQQLQPRLPGQLAGSASSNTTIGSGLSAKPGNYELHFICDGPSEAELSVSSWAGVEVLAPVQVPCEGSVFKAQVQLDTEGVDLSMNPGNGPQGRYAFRLVPSA